jgi:putative PIN family toxin of toxin-antitoxin system
VSSRIERIVLDTNVLVSAFLNPSGAPAQVLTLLLAGELRLLFDERILAEYAEVLARPRFDLGPTDVAEAVRQLEADGERVVASPSTAQLADEDDLPFLEVALSGKADALVTGNARHFPEGLGVVVLSPRALLQRLEVEQ